MPFPGAAPNSEPMTEPRSDTPAPDQNPEGSEKRLARAFGSAMIWNVANNIATNGITLAVFIFLTYKLNATVFGIFALGVIIVDFFNLQARSACIDATVQRRLYSRLEMDSIFWSMMAVTLVVIIVCAFFGSWLASANNEPSLSLIMPVLALTLLPIPLSVPPNAIMLREFDFRGGAIRGIVGALAGGAAALITVFSPFPEWALVAQRGTQVTVQSLILALRVRWWPGLQFSLPIAAGFLKDAGRIFAAQSISSFHLRSIDLIVAFSFGAAAVGLMRIAGRFVDILNGTFIAPISSLWVVLLSEKNQAAGNRDLIYRRLSQMSALFAMPIFGGLALVAHDLIAVALSDEYAQSGGILAILCLAGLFSPLTYFRNAAMIAVKRFNLLIAYCLFDFVLISVLANILAKHSLEAVIFSLVLLEAIRMLLTVPVLLRDMGTRLSGLILAVLPAYIATAVMGGAVWLVDLQMAGWDPLVRLLIKVAVGGFAYAGYLLIFHRDWSMTAFSMMRPSGRKASASDVTEAVA